jgi:hypothetical protein
VITQSTAVLNGYLFYGANIFVDDNSGGAADGRGYRVDYRRTAFTIVLPIHFSA